jgi:ATP-binding cassette, subfamily B, bacterial
MTTPDPASGTPRRDDRADGHTGAGDLDARGLVTAAWRLVARYVGWQRTSSALSLVASIAFSAAIVVSAQVVGLVTERLILPTLAEGGEARLTLGGAVALILAVSVWKALSIVLRRASAAWWQFRCEQRLRGDMVAHQLGLSLRWYAAEGVGDLLSISGTDTKQATRLLAPLPFAVGVLFLLVGSMVLVTSIDVVLGVLAGVTLLAVVAIDMFGSWLAFRRMEAVQARRGDLSTVAHESFDGALTIRALGREQEEATRFAGAAERLRDALVGLGRTWTGFRAVTELGPTLGTIGILYLATLRALDGAVSTADLVTIAYLLSLLVVPTRLIGYLVWDAAGSLAGWRRVERILEVDDRVTYGDRTLTPEQSDGAPLAGARVQLRGVGFAYDPDHPVLTAIDLDLEPGRTIAIVGRTGSGKSTLARLLARLWDPDTGVVRLDGVALPTFAPGVVATQVAYVPQEPFLFDDTLAGNIVLGDPSVSPADVARAIELAQLADVVAGLSDGLATRVGERGTTLSGGQQQRVGLARALARSPRLLILDDATSAIDAAVEAQILAGLRTAGLACTVVLVAARASTIVLADEIVHLADGRVAGQGRHEELVRKDPEYAALVEAYARDAERRRSTTRGASLSVRHADAASESDHAATAARREGTR